MLWGDDGFFKMWNDNLASLLPYVDSRIRSCWKNLQHVFLEILGWWDHWIIYNSEPYLNDLFFSWIHLSGQSPRGAWLRLSGDLEIKISWIAGNNLSTYWHKLCPRSIGFPECSTRTPRSEYCPDTVAAFTAVLELGEPLLGNFVRDHW